MNYLNIAGILTGIALLGSASIALAATTSPMSVDIASSGHASLKGTVMAVSSSTISVKSWGGVWSVAIGSSTKITPHTGAANDVSNIEVGDIVSVKGTARADATLTIDAKTVNDKTIAQTSKQERKDNHDAIKDFGKSVKATFQGIVSNLSGSAFTLTTNASNVFTIQTNAATKFLNSRFLALSGTTSINNNDNVRVFGTNASGTITAQIIRDLSIH